MAAAQSPGEVAAYALLGIVLCAAVSAAVVRALRQQQQRRSPIGGRGRGSTAAAESEEGEGRFQMANPLRGESGRSSKSERRSNGKRGKGALSPALLPLRTATPPPHWSPARPQASAPSAAFSAHWSEKRGRVFYHDAETQRSHWVLPEGGVVVQAPLAFTQGRADGSPMAGAGGASVAVAVPAAAPDAAAARRASTTGGAAPPLLPGEGARRPSSSRRLSFEEGGGGAGAAVWQGVPI